MPALLGLQLCTFWSRTRRSQYKRVPASCIFLTASAAGSAVWLLDPVLMGHRSKAPPDSHVRGRRATFSPFTIQQLSHWRRMPPSALEYLPHIRERSVALRIRREASPYYKSISHTTHGAPPFLLPIVYTCPSITLLLCPAAPLLLCPPAPFLPCPPAPTHPCPPTRKKSESYSVASCRFV